MTAFVARMMAAFCPSATDEQVKQGGLCDVIRVYDVVRVYNVMRVFDVIRGRVTQRHFSYRGCLTNKLSFFFLAIT